MEYNAPEGGDKMTDELCKVEPHSYNCPEDCENGWQDNGSQGAPLGDAGCLVDNKLPENSNFERDNSLQICPLYKKPASPQPVSELELPLRIYTLGNIPHTWQEAARNQNAYDLIAAKAHEEEALKERDDKIAELEACLALMPTQEEVKELLKYCDKVCSNCDALSIDNCRDMVRACKTSILIDKLKALSAQTIDNEGKK